MYQDPSEGTPEQTGQPPAVSAREVLPHAIRKGLLVFLELARIVGPIYLIVSLLNYTGVVTSLARVAGPAMRIFGLPGEAAVPIFTGWFLTIYAAAGALGALHLPVEAVTGVGLMILICHAIPMEWAVLQKMGAKATRITLMRLALSLVVGMLYALIYRGDFGATRATLPAAPASQEFGPFALDTLIGCLRLLGIILVLVVPLTAASETARATHFLARVTQRLTGRLGRLAPAEGILMPLLIGLTFGIVYGGGAMVALARTGAVKPEEARTVGLFLGLCHSLIDDPLLFVLLGGNVIWLYGVRILLALVLTPVLRRWA